MNRKLFGPKRTTSPLRGNTPPVHSSSGASVSSVNHNTWQTIRGHGKSPRVSYKRMLIQGTVPGSNVKGAPPLHTRSIFIGHVNRETSDDNMRYWISNQKNNIIYFRRLAHDVAKYKSYKLIVLCLIMFLCVNIANGPWEYIFPNITHQKQLKYNIMASFRKLTVSIQYA